MGNPIAALVVFIGRMVANDPVATRALVVFAVTAVLARLVDGGLADPAY